MYRLVGLKSIRNARLLVNKQKIVENKTQNFHSLINKQKNLLRPFGEFKMVKSVKFYETIEYLSDPIVLQIVFT